jgi:tetratricopeptide (TPR) repeat protein
MSKITIVFILIIFIFVLNISAMAQKQQIDPIEERSSQMFNQKQYNNAINLLSNAMKTNKNKTKYYVIRGLSYFNLSQFKLALEDFNIVIMRLPNEYRAYFFRGIVNINIKQYNQALIDFNKVIKLKVPEDRYHYLSDTYHYIGLTYYNKGDYEFAIKNLDESLRLNPQNSSPYFVKALSWDRKDEGTEAIKAYRDFLRLGPNAEAAKIQYAKQRLAALSEEAETDKTPQVSPKKPKKKPPKPTEPKTDVGKLFSAPLGEDAF